MMWRIRAICARIAQAAGLLLLLHGGAGGAQPAALDDIPVPYIPSSEVAVEEMLRLAAVEPEDTVVDLGSGDGRIVIAAAKYFGAKGIGIEIDPKLVAESEENARQAGVADRVRFHAQDVLKADISLATVVTMYLLSSLISKLRPKLLADLKPGTRIVAHDFPVEGWTPDRVVTISKTFYLYVVPAQVAGNWRLTATLPAGEQQYDFELRQDLQKITGGARVQGGYLPFFEARLTGDRISFVIVDDGRSHHFAGRVAGGAMEGVVRSGVGTARVENRWRAERLLLTGITD